MKELKNDLLYLQRHIFNQVGRLHDALFDERRAYLFAARFHGFVQQVALFNVILPVRTRNAGNPSSEEFDAAKTISPLPK